MDISEISGFPRGQKLAPRENLESKRIKLQEKQEKCENTECVSDEIHLEENQRAQRIKEIKAQILGGTYKIDSFKVADKILRDTLIGIA
ncbi:MAG: flagellar biosynthesis anti-sigma factor FlgM [Bdellovibrionota bacterium]|jgi:anti-sigma28 factor (negative regulator of flagellin synthesis)